MALGLLDTGFTACLLHCDGADAGTTITDESGKSWTNTGVTTRTAQKVFGSSSLLFSANGYAYTSDSNDFYLSADFTIDFWARFTNFPISGSGYQFWEQHQDNNNYQTLVFSNVAGVHSLNLEIKAASVDLINITHALPNNLNLNTWYHFRFTRTTNSWNMYCNGVRVGITESNSCTVPNFTGNVYLGCWGALYSFFNGYIDEFRIVRGKSVCSGASFVLPSIPYAPYLDDIYSVNLLHFNSYNTSTVIIDESSQIWSNSTCTIDTSQSRFGGSSLNLNGSSYLSLSPSSLTPYTLGNNDFTIEMWIRSNSLPSNGQYQILYSQYYSSNTRLLLFIYNNSGTYELRAEIWSGGVEYFSYAHALAGFATGAWHHIAWSTKTSVHRFFYDGVEQGPDNPNSYTIPLIASQNIYIGGVTGVTYWNGWIDEFRFSNGISRYNANFTPELSQFGPGVTQNQSLSLNTKHLSQDNSVSTSLPLLKMAIGSSWSLHTLSMTLPSLLTNINGETGIIGSVEFSLPLLEYTGNVFTGDLGEISFELPLLNTSLYGAGNVEFTLPLTGVSGNIITGIAGKLEAILPTLLPSLVGHLNNVGQLNFPIPVPIIQMAGLINGFGSISFNLPNRNIIIEGLTGEVGNVNVVLPEIKVNVSYYQNNLATIDLVIPMLISLSSGTYKLANVTYKGITINTKNQAVTEYSGFEFDSMGTINDSHFGVNENGIYILGGRNQNGSVITTGTLDFGQQSLMHRPSNVWITMRTNGKMILTVQVNENEKYDYEVSVVNNSIHEERVKTGKGYKGRMYSFSIKNIDGADFNLNKLTLFSEAIQSKKR